MASNKIIRSLCPLQFGHFVRSNSAILSAQFGHFVRPIRPFCPLYSAILSPLFGQNGRLFYIRNLIRVHCTPDSRWCHHYARACTRVHTREKTALKDAGWRARLAPFRYAAALIGALLRWFLQGFAGFQLGSGERISSTRWRYRPWRVAERPVFRGRAPDRKSMRRKKRRERGTHVQQTAFYPSSGG